MASTEEFIREFAIAKKRIRAMNYRYVEETDQTVIDGLPGSAADFTVLTDGHS
ncbi:hypothetical protein [Mesorhizobium sp.]|uniref:hypothetical protein n=1 Tax=Mesorhizobium sp. TaxID=1871066 RepID=UPI00257C70B5|nr:hypothetical protein [Mesorhizobium sp.]